MKCQQILLVPQGLGFVRYRVPGQGKTVPGVADIVSDTLPSRDLRSYGVHEAGRGDLRVRTEGQTQRFRPQICRAELTFSIAMREPDNGSAEIKRG